MGTEKGIVDLVGRLLPINVWKKHIVEDTGESKYLKDVIIHGIIQSIQTESNNPGSQDTNTCLLKRQREPQWSEGIHTYSVAVTKN